MNDAARARFAAEVRSRLDADPLRSRAEIARQAHVSATHLHRVARGQRWPSRGVAAALDDVFGAGGDLRAAWRAGERAHAGAGEPLSAPVEAVTDDPDTIARVRLAACRPHRVDAATVTAVADALAATRRLEDSVGAGAVLPSARAQLALAEQLVAGARPGVRRSMGAVAGELHQYTGWLFAETGDLTRARRHLDAALACGVEIDDPDLVSVALSFTGHVAWNRGDAGAVVALSRAAARDERVYVAQHAFNAFQEARGHGMAGDAAAVGRAAGRATELAGQAAGHHDDAPAGQYWYGPAFFTVQLGLAWQSLRDPRFAPGAARTLATGIAELPARDAGSEWAATFTLREAQAHTDSGDVGRATDAALRAGRTAIAYGSPVLARGVRAVRAEIGMRYPGARETRELDDLLTELPGRPRPHGPQG